MECSYAADNARELEGEDIGTGHWEHARQWMSIYADLLEFRRRILGSGQARSKQA